MRRALMEHTEKKAKNLTEATDVAKTGIVAHKKSLDSLAAQKVDGDNILGGNGATTSQEPSGISSQNSRRRKMESEISKSKI
jgi:hypothetical protein